MEVAASGIDILVQGNGITDGPGNLKAMDLAREAGIRILPFDSRILRMSRDQEVDTALIREVTEDYKNHPAFAGYVIKDEPHAELFPLLRSITEVFREEDPQHEPFINLFPSYGTIHQLGFDDYRTYVRSFIETVQPGILSYDNYPTRLDTTLYDAWYNDLGIVRKETLKAGIPFMIFILSEGIREGLRLPNRAEVLWQVNSAIAYGAHGFGWFCYWTPPAPELPKGAKNVHVEHHHDAMIDSRGEKTLIYDQVKEANAYIKNLGTDLLSWKSEEVVRYNQGMLIEGSFSVAEVNVKGRIILGTFGKNNKKRIIISNASCEEEALVTLKETADWKLSGVFTSIEAETTRTGGDMKAWKLYAGGSVVIDLNKN